MWYYNPAREPAVARAGDARRLFSNVLSGWTRRTACAVDPNTQPLLGMPLLLTTAFAGDVHDIDPRDGALVVRYVDDILQGCPGALALACARVRYSENGPIVGAELIMLSDAGMGARGLSWSTSDTPRSMDVDLQATLMHEAGHVLGLDHASRDGGQVMSPVIRSGDEGLASRRPGAGDLAGRDLLYP